MKAIASNGVEIQTGDTVLVRNTENGIWVYCHFSHVNGEYKYITSSYLLSNYCIPYKGNENLVGTNKDFTKSFKFKFGAKVKAWNTNYDKPIKGILIDYHPNDDYRYRVAYLIGEEEGDTNWFKNIVYLE